MNAALLTTIIMAVSAVGVPAVGGWYAYRASRRNAETSHDIEQDRLTAESWERQLKAWREDVVLLRQQRAEDTLEYTTQHKECLRQIAELTVQVRELQRQHAADEERHRVERQTMTTQLASMITWARTVVGLLTAAGIAFPKPPPGIQDTNPDIPRPT